MRHLIPLLLFLIIYLSHAHSPVIQSTDSMWALPTAVSIIDDGDFTLGEYKALIKAKKFYGIKRTRRNEKGRKPAVNLFPYGTSLMITPVVAILHWSPHIIPVLVPGVKKTDEPTSIMEERLVTERAIASFIVALTAVLWFYIAASMLPLTWSSVLTFSFSFGTSAWSTASRGLWQHGPIMLLISLSLLLLLKQKKESFAGLLLSFGYVVRPTMAIFWGLTAAYLFFKKRSALILYGCYTILILCLFFLLNKSIYGVWLPFYYKPGRLSYHPDFFQALLASLFSPNRGMIFQSPFLLLSLFTIPRILKNPKENLLLMLCWMAIASHVVATSAFPNWWHGHSFGSRYMTDILPYFFLLMVYTISEEKYWMTRGVFLILVAISVPIHYLGANNVQAFGWNMTPENIDLNPERVWSFSDWQPVRGITLLKKD